MKQQPDSEDLDLWRQSTRRTGREQLERVLARMSLDALESLIDLDAAKLERGPDGRTVVVVWLD